MRTQDQKHLDALEILFNQNGHTILAGYRGSVAHGTYSEDTSDDVDLFGCVIANPDYYIGMQSTFDARQLIYNENNTNYDISFYELKRFLGLLSNANPNMFPLLWLDTDHYLIVTNAGRRIIDNRRLFISKRLHYSFIGYAEHEYNRIFKQHKYESEKRRILLENVGYDCIHASHCLRLLRMYAEFLDKDEFTVYREEDYEFFTNIKQGKVQLETVVNCYDALYRTCQERYVKRNDLPDEPNTAAINTLCKHILREHLDYSAEAFTVVTEY